MRLLNSAPLVFHLNVMQQAHPVNTQSIMHSRLTPITHKHMTQQSTFAQISTITGSHKHGTESGIAEGDDSLVSEQNKHGSAFFFRGIREGKYTRSAK